MLLQEILVHQTLKKTKVSNTKIGNWSLIANRNSSRLPCHKALPHDAFWFICDQILKVNSNVIVSCIYDNLATPRESPTAYIVFAVSGCIYFSLAHFRVKLIQLTIQLIFRATCPHFQEMYSSSALV